MEEASQNEERKVHRWHCCKVVEEGTQTVTLGKQLAAAGGMMLVMTIVHALGLTGISRALHLRHDHLKRVNFGFKSVFRMSGMAVLLLSLHMVEIGIFAALYLAIGALQDVQESLYYSASAYTTLGRTEEFFSPDWRLLGAIEALIGFLLIGWSTAFIVSKADKIMPG